MAEKSWIVRGGNPDRFQREDKTWRDGDTITEEDLLGIFEQAQIELLIADGSLEMIPGRTTRSKK